MTDSTDFKALIGRVASGAALSVDESRAAFDAMMAGEATPSQMGGFLMALRVRGETVDEITGGAQAMRPLPYFTELFRLADNAGLLCDPEHAVARMRRFLCLYGIED